jgi:hypothetical protein
MGEIAIALSPEKNLNDVPPFLAPFLEEMLTRGFFVLTSPEADELTGMFLFVLSFTRMTKNA